MNKFGYNGNSRVKRDGVQQHYTPEEFEEYRKCAESCEYFVSKYMKVIHVDRGLVNFKPYDYQKKMFKTFNDNRFSVVLSSRQSGKSVNMIAYTLWFALFHADKKICILANKAATAREMLGRLQLALENIPFFLQPGCKELNKGNIEFSNNSEVMAASTSSGSIRGMSCALIVMDEFAFVHNDVEFFTSTYPVISSGKETKVIVVSTPNGVGNMFHKIWEGAVQGTNEFVPFRVDWWDVPGRDEEWKRETIANTSATQFRQEFELDFGSKGDTLISSTHLLSLQSVDPSESSADVHYYKEPEEAHSYIACIDVSRGIGQDYSTIQIIDVTTNPLEEVAVFRCNTVSPLILPDIVVKLANLYNEALIIVESNGPGEVVCNSIWYEHEYENMFNESMIKKRGLGLTMTKRVKRMGCATLKDLIEQDKLKIVDSETIIELSQFERRGASYEAKKGCHDDLVMPLVSFAWFTTTEFFVEYADLDIKKMIWKDRIREIEDDLVPIGILGNLEARENVLHPEYAELAEGTRSFREWN